jgi:hypothetical protein
MFFQYLKHCGRDAGLFVVIMAVVFVAAPLWKVGGSYVLAGLLLAWMARVIYLVFEPSRSKGGLGKFPPLSRNDLEAARSKLLRRRRKH